MDSDDIDHMYFEEISFLKLELYKNGPSFIVKQRKECGEFSTLYESLIQDEKKFQEYTRMSISTFNYILNIIEPRLKVTKTNFHTNDSIKPAEKLIITLRYLATGISFRALAFSFRMGKTTVADIVYKTCSALWEELASIHMPHPTRRDLKKIASDYYALWQFPNCIGSIDGKHCKIRCPANSGSSFFNYKQHFSIILQAVADAKKKFVAIEVGGKGKQSDGGTFHYSTLNFLLENGQMDLPEPENIPGTTTRLPYVLVADEAYPLKTNIMRPFPSRNLDTKSEYFNKRLSRARKCIECAFGILCAKWRILNKPIETNVEHACLIIKATCILHNVIRDMEVNLDIDSNILNTNTVNETCPNRLNRRNNSSSIAARNIRNLFSDYFWDHKL